MRYLLIIIIVLSLFLACSKDEDYEKKPKWLDETVDSIISDKDLCSITCVTVYQYNGEYYYDIYCQLWSCMMCHVYDEEGNKVDFEQEEFKEFLAEKVEVDEFPAC